MRTYYELIKHLKTVFEEDENVHTVVTDGYIDMDNYRKNIYPIVDIFIVDSPYIETNTALTRFTVEVSCLDVRDINKEQIIDKFWLNDNRHDNWNTTHAILKKAQNKLLKDHLDTNITLESASSLERKVWVKENGLDGWTVTWTIDIPDNYTTVC